MNTIKLVTTCVFCHQFKESMTQLFDELFELNNGNDEQENVSYLRTIVKKN